MTDEPTRKKVIPKKGGLFIVGDNKKPAKEKKTTKPVESEDQADANQS